MEIDELKAIWQKYDHKLDHLEKLNKKLIMETLTKKPQKKLNWIKYRTTYSMFIVPIALIIALSPNFRIEKMDVKFLFGCLFFFGFIIYHTYINYTSYKALKNIDFSNDSIINSLNKMNDFKNIIVRTKNCIPLTYSILFAGVLFIEWNVLIFNVKTFMLFVCLFIFTMVVGNKQSKIYKEKIERLEKEIHDLDEYTE